MATPAIAPDAPQKEFNWKRLFIKAAGFGVGFALMLAVLASVGVWYWNRPKPLKPWDHYSISAEYDHVRVRGDKNHITFGYILTNHTNEDIRIESDTTLTYAIKAKSQNALQVLTKGAMSLDFPIILPPNERVYLPVELNMSYKEPEKDNATLDERKQFRKEVETYFLSLYDNIAGIEIRLDDKRMAIDLPATWNETKK